MYCNEVSFQVLLDPFYQYNHGINVHGARLQKIIRNFNYRSIQLGRVAIHRYTTKYAQSYVLMHIAIINYS